MSAEEITIPVTEHTEEFHITDERSANWFLRKLANIEAERARVKAQCEEIVRGLNAEESRLKHLFGGELEAFARQQLEGRHCKTLRLMQGTCAFRTVPSRIKVKDESQAREFATLEAMCDAFVTSFSPSAYLDIAEARLQRTGELIPGVELVPERESFSIRFGKEKETV